MMIDILIAVTCITVVGVVVAKGVISMKTGKNTSCGCGCSGCSSTCHCKEEKK